MLYINKAHVSVLNHKCKCNSILNCFLAWKINKKEKKSICVVMRTTRIMEISCISYLKFIGNKKKKKQKNWRRNYYLNFQVHWLNDATFWKNKLFLKNLSMIDIKYKYNPYNRLWCSFFIFSSLGSFNTEAFTIMPLQSSDPTLNFLMQRNVYTCIGFFWLQYQISTN